MLVFGGLTESSSTLDLDSQHFFGNHCPKFHTLDVWCISTCSLGKYTLAVDFHLYCKHFPIVIFFEEFLLGELGNTNFMPLVQDMDVSFLAGVGLGEEQEPSTPSLA